MKRFLLISFFALFSFLPPTISEAKNACTLNDTIILIKPFTSKKSSPRSLILPLLIKDYLNLSSKISARFQEAQKQPTLILKGTLTPKGTDYAFQSQIEKLSGEVIFRYEGLLEASEYPKNLNSLVIDYVLKATQALDIKLKEKSILPFLNQTSSAEAYTYYAEGMTSFWAHDLIKSQKAFETAIKNDYNYIPAYVGLSQVLKELMNAQSEVEWQKAQLLNPDLSKMIRERSFCP